MSGLVPSWVSNSIPKLTWSFKETDLVQSSAAAPQIDLKLRTNIQALTQIKTLCEKYPDQSPPELTATITDFTQKIAGLKGMKGDVEDTAPLTGATVTAFLMLFTMLRIDLVVKLAVVTGGALSGSLLALGLCVAAGLVVGIAAKYFAKRALAKEEASIDSLEPKVTQLLMDNKMFLNRLLEITSKSSENSIDQTTAAFINQLNPNLES